MRITRRYVVRGRVQGVGFRYFTQAAAVQEDVQGWVRNLPDGSVEALASGAPDAVERFERHIRKGPPGGRVDAVNVDGADEECIGFHIRS
jgi:acylphosphatase